MKSSIPFIGEGKVFILPGMLVVAIIGLIIFSSPFFGKLGILWEELGKLSLAVTSLSAKRDGLTGTDATILTQRVNLAGRALPKKPKIAAIFSAVSEVAQQNNLKVTQIQFTPTGEEDGVVGAKFRVDLEGTIGNVRSFLNDISRSLPFVKVLDGKISQSEGTTQISVSLETYGKNFPQALPKIEESLPGFGLSEEELLLKLSGFRERVISLSTFSSAGSRPNPFSF